MLVLVTSKPDMLLHTIYSRCQDIYFGPHSKETIKSYLRPKNLSDNQEDFLCSFSNGSIGLLAGIDDFKDIKRIAEEYSVLGTIDINKRFAVAKTLSLDEDLKRKVFFWMLYLRSKKLYSQLPNVLALHRTVSYAGYNEQLALENFMLSF